ncbi:hypothetical protein CSOJ01_08004 [Colletotrichum sojae]|uniref:Uncharacterized protein n=1 Tax=Colletotrichum sojae TaxID=2175907 RepID=A0A8H6MST3_9PEZI|nr:hypothetical protein CSOJ01_08004 [Colletotrichum sojae]
MRQNRTSTRGMRSRLVSKLNVIGASKPSASASALARLWFRCTPPFGDATTDPRLASPPGLLPVDLPVTGCSCSQSAAWHTTTSSCWLQGGAVRRGLLRRSARIVNRPLGRQRAAGLGLDLTSMMSVLGRFGSTRGERLASKSKRKDAAAAIEIRPVYGYGPPRLQSQRALDTGRPNE